MHKPLSEQELGQIEARARHAKYYVTFHYDFDRGSTAWQNAEKDILALVDEVRHLRRSESTARKEATAAKAMDSVLFGEEG